MESVEKYRRLAQEREDELIRETANIVIARVKKKAYDGEDYATVKSSNSTIDDRVYEMVKKVYKNFILIEEERNGYKYMHIYWNDHNV